MEVSQKIILITGASSGIGAATARELASRGAFIILVARNVEKLKVQTEQIVQNGGRAVYFSADLSVPEEVKQLASRVKAEIGIPDVLINNAGQGRWKFMDETGYEEVSKMMAVPYYAAFYLTKAFLPEMLDRNSGFVVNMTSYAGFIAFSGATAYIAARTAMVGFHQALTADLYGTGVKTSLAYFAKVTSDYWENNPGSEERLPTSQVLIPIITPQKAARAMAKGLEKEKRKIRTPFMIDVMDFLIRYFPRLTRWLIHKTGYRR